MDPDKVAQLVVDAFNKQPKKAKPIERNNGDIEWTVLAGIVVQRGEEMECVCFATGLKSTPDHVLEKANGEILHDMHAEILAIRGFNRFLIDTHDNSKYFQNGKLKGKVYMYVSEAPCGDASVGLMSRDTQGEIWNGELFRINNDANAPVAGRDHFHINGLVRTKPGRRDAQRTFSKSCTDKLALRQNTSLLLGPVSKLIKPIYLNGLIVPEHRFIKEDYERAFRERITSNNYFEFHTTRVKFQYERTKSAKPCPQTLLFIQDMGSEAIINGIKMGTKRGTCRAASIVSRSTIWKAVLSALQPDHKRVKYESYLEFKHSKSRQEIKQAAYLELGNWVCTSPDDFSL